MFSGLGDSIRDPDVSKRHWGYMLLMFDVVHRVRLNGLGVGIRKMRLRGACVAPVLAQ